jgi:hypothetical protein
MPAPTAADDSTAGVPRGGRRASPAARVGRAGGLPRPGRIPASPRVLAWSRSRMVIEVR